MAKEFVQTHYSNIEIDFSESDVIILHTIEESESNLILIERKNIEKLCKLLLENKETIIRSLADR